jgi:cytochrome oxidase assembly protein ShyY1
VVLRRPAGDLIAAAKEIGAVAPFSSSRKARYRRAAGKLVVTLPDNHLQYALTWYGLTGVLVISFVTRAFGSGEEPGGAEDAPPRQGISPSL